MGSVFKNHEGVPLKYAMDLFDPVVKIYKRGKYIDGTFSPLAYPVMYQLFPEDYEEGRFSSCVTHHNKALDTLNRQDFEKIITFNDRAREYIDNLKSIINGTT